MEFKKKPKHSIKRPTARESLGRDDDTTGPVTSPAAAASAKATHRSAPPHLITRATRAITTQARALPRFKKSLIIGGIVVAIAATTYGVTALNHERQVEHSAKESVKSLERQAILPKNSSIDALGGWTQTKTPANEPIFTYADTVAGVPISLSQQLLPKDAKTSAQSQVADIAKKINATDKIDAGGITAYIGTSTKGPQYVVLTKNNLLILIKSQNKIDNNAWATYAESLK